MAITAAPTVDSKVPSSLFVAIGDGDPFPLGYFDLDVRTLTAPIDVDQLLSSRPLQLQVDRAALRASLAAGLRDAAAAVEAMADEDLPGA